MKKSEEKKPFSFDWRTTLLIAAVSSGVTLVIGDMWGRIREKGDYSLSYRIEAKPHILTSKGLLGSQKRPVSLITVRIRNSGLKTQKGVALLVRFKHPILNTYVPEGLQICDHEGNSLVKNYEAFRGSSTAGVNVTLVPSGLIVPIAFALDCKYSEGMEKQVIDLIEVTSEAM